MRVAVLSDTHFGDDLCTLVIEPPKSPPQLGPAYPALARAVGRADYLVVLGDVLDFSVASFEKAYRHAKVFFSAPQADGLARQLIYIPATTTSTSGTSLSTRSTSSISSNKGNCRAHSSARFRV